jgi:hypothetical protein
VRQLKDRVRRTVRGTRAWVAPAGRLPGFLIIGGQRCGTTSLYRYLAAHPEVTPATGKELQYFTVHYGRGERWYRGHFPRTGLSFEASPYYLLHPEVPARVAATLPEARFVAILRDPVHRAWSHYLHNRAYGSEPLGFAEALGAEPARLARALERGPDTRAAHAGLRTFSYASRGRYAEQLSRWFAEVPRERLHVLRTEQLAADPIGAYTGLLRFLGLPEYLPAEFTRYTRRADPDDPPADVAERLRAGFAPHNAALATLLGWPANPWP